MWWRESLRSRDTLFQTGYRGLFFFVQTLHQGWNVLDPQLGESDPASINR